MYLNLRLGFYEVDARSGPPPFSCETKADVPRSLGFRIACSRLELCRPCPRSLHFWGLVTCHLVGGRPDGLAGPLPLALPTPALSRPRIGIDRRVMYEPPDSGIGNLWTGGCQALGAAGVVM